MDLVTQAIAFWAKFTSEAEYTISILISVIIFTVLYFYIIKFLVSNNSSQLVTIFVLLMIIVGGIFLFNRNMPNGLFLLVPTL